MLTVEDNNPGEFATRPQLTATDFKRGDAWDKDQEAFKRVRTMITRETQEAASEADAAQPHDTEHQI